MITALPTLLIAAQPVPSPPPLMHDWGPRQVMVLVDDHGLLLPDQEQPPFSFWTREPRGAFLLCYRQRDGTATLPESATAAIDNVAELLKRRGATMVATMPDPTCSGAAVTRWRHQSMVEITELVVR